MDRNTEAKITITAYPDGPYLVRGPFTLVDPDGAEIEVHRKIVALCRCGRSRLRPFCDGTHKLIGFKTPEECPVQLELQPNAAVHSQLAR